MGGDGSVLEVLDQEKSPYDHHRQISVSEGRKDVYTVKTLSFDTPAKGSWSFMFKLKAENCYNKTYLT